MKLPSYNYLTPQIDKRYCWFCSKRMEGVNTKGKKTISGNSVQDHHIYGRLYSKIKAQVHKTCHEEYNTANVKCRHPNCDKLLAINPKPFLTEEFEGNKRIVKMYCSQKCLHDITGNNPKSVLTANIKIITQEQLKIGDWILYSNYKIQVMKISQNPTPNKKPSYGFWATRNGIPMKIPKFHCYYKVIDYKKEK